MRAPLAAAGAVLVAVVAAVGVEAVQPVEPMAPTQEQQIEILHPAGSQGLEQVTAGSQDVRAAEPASPARRAASTAGKVVLGVVAGAVAVGAAIVSLLFL